MIQKPVHNPSIPTSAQRVQNTKTSENTASAAQSNRRKAESPGVEFRAMAAPTSSNYRVDTDAIRALKAGFARQTESFREMVRKMIETQGVHAGNDLKALTRAVVTPEVQAEAQAETSEQGYWGVEQTSTRILDFAKALSGGDPAKIETLKNAFQRGFDAAKRLFGGQLPEISQKTYDAVMKGFAEWENSGASVTETASKSK